MIGILVTIYGIVLRDLLHQQEKDFQKVQDELAQCAGTKDNTKEKVKPLLSERGKDALIKRLLKLDKIVIEQCDQSWDNFKSFHLEERSTMTDQFMFSGARACLALHELERANMMFRALGFEVTGNGNLIFGDNYNWDNDNAKD